MCGFAGYLSFNSPPLSDDILLAMGKEISHRGPDDFGIEKFCEKHFQLGFSFRRLSVIELSEFGHQPMFSNNKEIGIVFNGEIYNYLKIKSELENFGYKFYSKSDTEVIIQAYCHWGISCIDKFIGMFSIALYDKEKQKLFLIRDRAGVKPLFWYWKNNNLIFASELKSFHKHPFFEKSINKSALTDFFMYGYINTPHCIYENTYKLKSGHFLEVDLITHSITENKYWDIIDFANQPILEISYKDAIAETEKLLVSACNYRMIADVPVGVFLSGGYDSSAVTALLQRNNPQKIKTFTIGFQEDSFNEAHHAKKVAEHLGTNHHEYYCTYKEALEIIPTLPFIYDEPFGDSSAIPTILVSKMARKEVTVALSADGGDEQFAGYPHHVKAVNYFNKNKQIPAFARSFVANISDILPGEKNIVKYDRIDKLSQIMKSKDPIWNYAITSHAFTLKQTSELVLGNKQPLLNFYNNNNLFAPHVDILTRVLVTDYKTYMSDDILTKVDRASMSVSLEGREPLLDHRIAELVMQFPSDYKLKNGVSKRILKDIVHKYVPREIMERPKMGFGIPVERWLRNELKPLLLETLATDKISKQGVLNAEKVKQAVEAYLNKDKNVDFQRIWFLLMFQMWYDKWMN